MLCPKCGNDLIYEWDVTRGVWQKCAHCDFRTKDNQKDENY